jgi:predicted glycosyltransferase
MAAPSTFNILMYSHDTYGLGHLRRTMAIAEHLRHRGVNILILTGSPLAGRYEIPEGIDYVRIPGMIKKTNEEYLPLSIKINARHALNIRRNIIVATAKAFQPHLFIVDKAPMGLRREVIPTLKWLKRRQPRTRTILGLRDIMDDAASTIREWREKGVYEVLDQYYSEIWVYGNQELYDPVTEYEIPDNISRKMIFTGYIPRRIPAPQAMTPIRREERLGLAEKLVVVTTGGGGDGYPLMDAYLRMLEEGGGPEHRVIFVTGPFMPRPERELVAKRAARVKARFYHFYRRMETLMGLADAIVTMGGYNTTCEILSQGKPSLVVPREVPRLEQRIRAEVLSRQGLIEFLPWDQLSADGIREKLTRLLADPHPYQEAMSRFPFTGLKIISERLHVFRQEVCRADSAIDCPPDR